MMMMKAGEKRDHRRIIPEMIQGKPIMFLKGFSQLYHALATEPNISCVYMCVCVLNCCVLSSRYPNLDFGWKRSIDSKTFISCPESCTEDGEDHCKHEETVNSDPSSPTETGPHHSPPPTQGPSIAPGSGDDACTRNLINGTALVTSCDNGHREEHLHQRDNCQRSRPGSPGTRSHESVQTTTSVPVQPSHSLNKPSSGPPQPSDECTPRRTSDHTNKATSVCSRAATGPDAPTAPSLDLAAVRSHRAEAGDSLKSLGPNPGLILQALTLSNASDGFNLERLEMLGDSFLKHAITTYLFCTYPDAHEGRLSYMRSKKVSCLTCGSYSKEWYLAFLTL